MVLQQVLSGEARVATDMVRLHHTSIKPQKRGVMPAKGSSRSVRPQPAQTHGAPHKILIHLHKPNRAIRPNHDHLPQHGLILDSYDLTSGRILLNKPDVIEQEV
jgi:hypothetical protein